MSTRGDLSWLLLHTRVLSSSRVKRCLSLQGIIFSVRPPKKSWKNIANLSGGEKTLSSLSLVFALHHYKPTPLYVMDEIDAALGMPPNLPPIIDWLLLECWPDLQVRKKMRAVKHPYS